MPFYPFFVLICFLKKFWMKPLNPKNCLVFNFYTQLPPTTTTLPATLLKRIINSQSWNNMVPKTFMYLFPFGKHKKIKPVAILTFISVFTFLLFDFTSLCRVYLTWSQGCVFCVKLFRQIKWMILKSRIRDNILEFVTFHYWFKISVFSNQTNK